MQTHIYLKYQFNNKYAFAKRRKLKLDFIYIQPLYHIILLLQQQSNHSRKLISKHISIHMTKPPNISSNYSLKTTNEASTKEKHNIRKKIITNIEREQIGKNYKQRTYT